MKKARVVVAASPQERFPANLIHDGSQEVMELFPDRWGATSNSSRGTVPGSNCSGVFGATERKMGRADSGSATRSLFGSETVASGE